MSKNKTASSMRSSHKKTSVLKITDRPIKYKCSLNNTILHVLRTRGWQELSSDDDDFDFFWCTVDWMKDNFDRHILPDHVRISHFRNHFELTRKNLMVKNLKRLRKTFEKECGTKDCSILNFIPTTFELPMEYHMFLEEFRKNPGSTWIMKPVAKSQGRGIFLFRKIKDIEAWRRVANPSYNKNEGTFIGDTQIKESPENYVVSRYIDDPYLISSRKFDLRVYVLVTSIQPLKIWVYRDGFARLSNTPFSLDSLDDQYVHLTNVAIQKTAPDYDADRGLKWSVCRLRRFLIAKHGYPKVDEIFRNIDVIFVASLLSVQKIMINDKHCFELYGYDILLDNDLKPWLLEINASPSLSASSNEDRLLKTKMLNDVLNIIDMEGKLTGKEKSVGDFDLIWDEGPVSAVQCASKAWLTEVSQNLSKVSSTNTSSTRTSSSRLNSSKNVNNLNSSAQLSSVLTFSALNSHLGCLQCNTSYGPVDSINDTLSTEYITTDD